MAFKTGTTSIGLMTVSANRADRISEQSRAGDARSRVSLGRDARSRDALETDETVVVGFSNGTLISVLPRYLTPIWRLQSRLVNVLVDLDHIALEFPVALDATSVATREVQAIVREIPAKHSERYLSVYRETWSEQNEMRPEDLRAKVVYSSPEDHVKLRSFVALRAHEDLVLGDGSRPDTVEAVTDHFAVDVEHALFVELSYFGRLAPEKVDQSLQAVLQGQAL